MRQRTSLTALLMAAAFVACAIDDRQLDVVHGAGGSRGGSAGSTGGSGEGGTAGKGGAAGKGGSAGSAGKGGTAGTAGTGPTDCNGDPLDIDEDLIRACLMQTGCSPFIPGSSLSFCITNQRLETFPQDDCGSNAADCTSFLGCLGVGYYSPSGCTTGDAAYCESATLAVTCNRYPYAVDCAHSGGECATFTDAAGTLRARCRQPALEGCTDPPDAAQCGATDIAYTCIDGQAFGTNCRDVGAECRDGSCYYVLESCPTPGTSCNGSTTLDICYDTNELAGYDCASGLGCVEDDTASAECRAPGCPTDEACSESCSGTELTFCYGRVPVTIDCADYGFRTCITTTLSGSDELTSYCAFPETAPDRVCEVRDIDDACFACGKQNCCSEWTACLDDADCVDYLVCANECAGASACIDVCESMYPLGLAVYTEYAVCRDLACPTECG